MPMGNERSGIPVGERTTGRPASARRRGRDGAFDSAAQDPAHPIPGAQSLLDDNASRCAPPPGARERRLVMTQIFRRFGPAPGGAGENWKIELNMRPEAIGDWSRRPGEPDSDPRIGCVCYAPFPLLRSFTLYCNEKKERSRERKGAAEIKA